MRKVLFGGIGLLALSGALPGAPALSIEHQPVTCAVAERFPRMEARLVPGGVARARVVFQGQNTEWYSVDMKPDGARFFGVLPKPMKSLKRFRYYIEVTDKTMGTNRTADYDTDVVDSTGGCKGRVMAASLGSASILLQGPAGVFALPAGFASSGVVIAGSAAGSAAAGAGASAAGAGGGIGTTALVIGGLAAAGGVAAVAVPKGGNSSDSSGSSGPGGSTRSILNVTFLPSPPGIDVSVCSTRQLTWGGQTVSVDANGNFNETWAPNEPNTARISGQATATTFQATIACTNGARTGSMTATGSNGSYSGTFAFGPSTGQLTITKQ